MKGFVMFGCLATALLPAARAQQQPDPAAIRRKVQRGETLTPEERRFLVERLGRVPGAAAPADRKAQMGSRRTEWLENHQPKSSWGLTALTDLAGKYQGEEGGLYPGGANTPPKAHLDAGLRIARGIVPRDAEGRASAGGKIALLSIGFSNPNIEFPAFQKRVAADASVNPKLALVNGCVGGQAASVIADPGSNYWKLVAERLAGAGVTTRQVSAVWLKLVNPAPSAPFPAESKKLHHDIVAALHNLHERFPNLGLVYISSRTYGGYTETGGSPEPWAYETAFSVKWAVADQIAGRPDLNFDPARGPVKAPWIAWGPYLWTDGEKGRRDGFVYLREDLREDGLHPSDKGSAKIARLMLEFFRSDPSARPWFLK